MLEKHIAPDGASGQKPKSVWRRDRRRKRSDGPRHAEARRDTAAADSQSHASGRGLLRPVPGQRQHADRSREQRADLYGMDIDPSYVDVAVLRWQRYTGQSAVLDGDGRTFEEIARVRGRNARESKFGPQL